jgi:hypothetical protein
MLCHSVACGILKSATPLTTRNSTAAQHDAVIRVYDEASAVIETHKQAGDFKEP